jgi:hypothetical protein
MIWILLLIALTQIEPSNLLMVSADLALRSPGTNAHILRGASRHGECLT